MLSVCVTQVSCCSDPIDHDSSYCMFGNLFSPLNPIYSFYVLYRSYVRYKGHVSTMLVEIVLCACVPLLLLLFSLFKRRPEGMPPGPKPLPIIGNMLQVARWMANNQIQIELAKEAQKYGGIFTFDHLPGERTVVINSESIAREAYLTRKDDFAGRPYKFTWDFLQRGGKDIANGDFSPTLIRQRKIVHAAFRNYIPFLEETLVREADELCRRLSSYDGEPRDLEHDVMLTTMNIICDMVYGGRYKMDDPEFLMIVDYNKAMFALLTPVNVLNVFPFLIHFPIKDSKKIKKVRDQRDLLLETKLHEHQATYQDGVIRDLTDALIKVLNEAQLEDSEIKNTIATEDYVIMTISDAFSGGLETTMTTILWFIAYMINYPQVQKKIHQELDDVIGRYVNPHLEDKGKLHYLEAAITETLRLAAVVPLAVPHKAVIDSTLAGHKIPKGTTLLFNIWAMHYDEKEWDKPHVFDPTRFIDDEGKFTKGARDTSYFPFGAGRRVCIGEALAKQELFIVLSRLMQRFRFIKLPEGCPPPEMIGDMGLVHAPKPYKVCVEDR